MMFLLDDFSGYNQNEVKRIDKYKTTLITRWGTFSYECMHFVLSNVGVTFQRAMQIGFDDLIHIIIQTYLDDLTVYSKNRLDHFGHLRNFLIRCRKLYISLNPSKSIFNVTKGKLLGHIVSDLRISIDLERIVAILNIVAPTSKKEVEAFMGIINFVCRFVPDFSILVKPIHNLLKKDPSFSWTNGVKNSFVRIKKEISSAPVLAKPNFEKEFIIYINSIEEMIQVDIGGHPPFPTGSKQFSGNFGNLLFLAVFHFRSHFEALNDVFWENGEKYKVPSIFPPK
jgi:hypothetical protein